MQHLTPSSSSGQPQLPSGTPAPWELPPRAPSSRCRGPPCAGPPGAQAPSQIAACASSGGSAAASPPAGPGCSQPHTGHTQILRGTHRSCGTPTDPAGTRHPHSPGWGTPGTQQPHSACLGTAPSAPPHLTAMGKSSMGCHGRSLGARALVATNVASLRRCWNVPPRPGPKTGPPLGKTEPSTDRINSDSMFE